MLTLWINWACETKNTILCQVSLFTEDMREDTTNAIENYSKILASKPEWVLRIQAFYKLHIHWTIWTSDLCRLSGTFFVQDHCKYKITLKKKYIKERRMKYLFQYPSASYYWSWLMLLVVHLVLPKCMREGKQMDCHLLKMERKPLFLWHSLSFQVLWPPAYKSPTMLNRLPRVPRPWLGTHTSKV